MSEESHQSPDTECALSPPPWVLAPVKEEVAKGDIKATGFLLVNLAAKDGAGHVWATLVVDIRSATGTGSARGAMLSVDFDPPSGRYVRAAHVTVPVNAGETYRIYYSESSNALPLYDQRFFYFS